MFSGFIFVNRERWRFAVFISRNENRLLLYVISGQTPKLYLGFVNSQKTLKIIAFVTHIFLESILNSKCVYKFLRGKTKLTVWRRLLWPVWVLKFDTHFLSSKHSSKNGKVHGFLDNTPRDLVFSVFSARLLIIQTLSSEDFHKFS